MNQGLIEQVGTPMDVYRHPRSAFVADFIGRANFIEATVVKGGSGDLVVSVHGTPVRLKTVQETYGEGEKMTLIARPEMIQVSADGGLSGIVRRASYLGNMIDYDVEVSGQLLTAVETDPRRTTIFPEGATVGVNLLADCIHILPKS
jgi:iron(III) transport system ATP-binding protein